MRTEILADRYAQALHDALGEKKDQLEAAAAALNAISSFYADDTNLRHVLGNSALDMDGRRKILDLLLDAYEVPESVRRLLHIALAYNRTFLLPVIATRFESHIDECFNRIEVTVVTAMPLTPELEGQLITSLEQFTNKNIRMNNKVNPNIVGGLIVYMFDVFFDFSLRSRLDRMKEKLLSEAGGGIPA